MNSSSLTLAYPLPVLDKILNHGWRAPQSFHDAEISKPHSRRTELVAQVASQDYFAMVATSLDKISHHLKLIHHSYYFTLEDTIEDLLYLQANYKIVKK
jgi:hypothetical protein